MCASWRFCHFRAFLEHGVAYDWECMDADASDPLVSLSSQQGSLVPVARMLSTDYHFEPDPLELLWQRFCELVWLLFVALIALHRMRLQLIELRWQANYWRAQHQRAVQREADLKEQVEQLQGEIRELKRRLYGRKSETSSATKPPRNPNQTASDGKPKKRGQQPGSQGHGRRCHDHLPTTHEDCVLPDGHDCCAECGEPFEPIPGSTDGDILEIDVRAHRRRYHRQRYRRL
jgi:hypothetical protein